MKKNVILINLLLLPVLLTFQNCSQDVQFTSTPDVIKKIGEQQDIQIIDSDTKDTGEQLIVDNGAQDTMPADEPVMEPELPPGYEPDDDNPNTQILGDQLCGEYYDHNTASLNLIDNGCFEHTDERVGHHTRKALNQLVNRQWDVYDSLPGSSDKDSWVVESGNGIEVQRDTVVQPHSGNHYIELDSHGRNSNSSMSQTVEIMQPGDYRLAFYYLPRVSGKKDNTIDVYVNDEAVSTVTGSSIDIKGDRKAQSSWRLIVIDLQDVPVGALKITFSAVAEGDKKLTYGGLLDDVTLVPVLK